MYDPDWAFGDDGLLERADHYFDQKRVDAMGSGAELTQQKIPQGENDKYLEPGTDEYNDALIDARYADWAKSHLEKSVGYQNWFDKNITKKSADFLLGWGKSKADEIWGDQQFYQATSSVFESMGNILTMWGFTKLASKSGVFTQTGIQALSNTYFASSVFGSLWQDAINGGASYNDAFTYATGHAVLETLTEQIGGFTPGGSASASKKVFNNLRTKGWMGIIKEGIQNGLDEGFEELVSEFALEQV